MLLTPVHVDDRIKMITLLLASERSVGQAKIVPAAPASREDADFLCKSGTKLIGLDKLFVRDRSLLIAAKWNVASASLSGLMLQVL